jgi:hypothetical protein
VAVLVVLAVVAVLLTTDNLLEVSSPSTLPSVPAPSTVGQPTYSVSRTSILVGGAPYLPYGVTVFGLAEKTWQKAEASDLAQIKASASYWHANTVRIQVAPVILDDGTVGYLRAVENEVNTAETAGLNVILAAQYERDGKIPGPEASTVRFWKTIAPLYARNSRVWFDLFNEPTERSWSTWRNGRGPFVGMQTLVSDIRSVAPGNLILAEGLQGAKTLDGVLPYRLDGTGIVYEVHPYFDGVRYDSPAAWSTDWGDLTGRIPVLIGEWGEYEGAHPECRPDAPTLVPTFLTYVVDHRVGLIAWSLEAGVLIQGRDLSDPTTFGSGRSFACSIGATRGARTGVGEEVLQLFDRYSRMDPAVR